MLRGAFEEAEHRVGVEGLGIGRPPKAEGQPAKPWPARERAPEACHHLRGTKGCGDGKPDLRAARRRDDARRRDERERGHVLGLLDGQPERDDAAHGVAEHGAGEHSLELGDLVDVARVRGDALDVLERLGEPVTRQVGNQNAPPLRENRRELREVDRGTPEPVDHCERRPLAAEEVARSDAVDFRKVRAESPKERCLVHEGKVSFVHGLGRGAEPLSRSAHMEGLTSPPGRAPSAGFFVGKDRKETTWRIT